MARRAMFFVLASLVFCLVVMSAMDLLAQIRAGSHSRPCQTLDITQLGPGTPHDATSTYLYTAFDPVPLDNSSFSIYRRPDTVDTFAAYEYRQHPNCDISSLSLHKPFSPLCPDRPSFLAAFSGGGRIGFDAPFMPRDCDMRWYSTEEVCSILGRFEKVIFIGDSMMRHVVGAMNVLLRQDLGYGAVTGWNFGEEESKKCFCTHQMDVKACSVQGIYRTSDVLTHDPDSFACPHTTSKASQTGEKHITSSVNLIIELMLKFPLDPTEISRLQELLPKKRPRKPIAFILGHGLWNDLDLQATVNWMNGILEAIHDAAPYLHPANLPQEMIQETNHEMTHPTSAKEKADIRIQKKASQPLSHILFITPSAAGPLKPDQWITSQGDKALQVFEKSMHSLIHDDDGIFDNKGIEHMGTWNMSIQMEKWDGVHLDLRGNLLKAMGVVNWLGGIETESW